MDKKTLYTAIKPTGILTLGGFIGVGQMIQDISDKYHSYICVADLHALTILPEPDKLRENTFKLIAFYLALGLDPDKNTLYVQSHIDEHAKLAWILGTFTSFGQACRMTQFKDYQTKMKDTTVGLFEYPILMAGDILLFDTDIVPVGQDQKQHVELCRDIAIKFNYKRGEIFKIPEVVFRKEGAKIGGFQEPSKKMSKSEEFDTGTIFIEDSADQIRKIVKKAVTDSEGVIRFDPDNKPGISNLLTIYATLKKLSISEAEKYFEQANYGTLKTEVAETIIEVLMPIQAKYFELLNNKPYLIEVMRKGKEKAEKKAKEKIAQIYNSLGLVTLD